VADAADVFLPSMHARVLLGVMAMMESSVEKSSWKIASLGGVIDHF
jgi:hypothetical protein